MKYLTILIFSLLIGIGSSAQVVIPPLPTVPAPANLAELCEAYASMEELNGPNCLNPVWWDIEGFININAVVRYVDDVNVLRVGRVAGYAWQRDEDRYYYLLEVYEIPAEYASVAPERIDN